MKCLITLFACNIDNLLFHYLDDNTGRSDHRYIKIVRTTLYPLHAQNEAGVSVTSLHLKFITPEVLEG